MSRLQLRPAGWVLPSLLCFGLAIIYLFEWRTSRAEQHGTASAFNRTLEALKTKLVFESTQTRSLLASIKEGLDSVATRVDRLSRAAEQPTDEKGIAAAEPKVEPEEEAESSAPEDLPPLPEGVVPVDLVRTLNLEGFFADPTFNPGGAKLDRVGWQRAANLADRAQARLSALRSDIHLLVVEEAAKMREEGLYVDYEKGQKRATAEGVRTSGELLPGGGMRIFSFPRERYPRLYELEEEIKTVSEETIRRLMAMAKTD